MGKKALLALLGLGAALLFVVGCSGSNTQIVNPPTASLSGIVENQTRVSGQPDANVCLLKGDIIINTVQTDANGAYSITDIPPGTGYRLNVKCSATPPTFNEATTEEFEIVAGANTKNIAVSDIIITAVITGIMGTIERDADFEVSVLNGTTTIASSIAPMGVEPPFTLLDIPVGSGYLLKAVDSVTGYITIYGPVTVPEGGVSGIKINSRTADQLEDEGVPATANLIVYIPGGSIISADGKTSSLANPTWLEGVTPGDVTVTINISGQAPVDLTVPVVAGYPTIVRYTGP